jgi:hypothetical protein
VLDVVVLGRDNHLAQSSDKHDGRW